MAFGRGQNANTGNGRGMFAASHAVYSFLILLYFLAWIIELAGVSSTQYEVRRRTDRCFFSPSRVCRSLMQLHHQISRHPSNSVVPKSAAHGLPHVNVLGRASA
jgi:hypothetical protein